MPYDSNGNATINRDRAVTGQTAAAPQVNVPFDDVQSMLSQVLLRSGVAPMTGPLNMNGFRATGAADALADGDLVTLSQVQAIFNDPYALQPIGMPLPLDVGMAGFTPPPKNKSYRYIVLTAGQTGSGSYNEGILTGEVTSGSYPLIISYAVISLAGSPFNGSTVRLINTERRFLRAGYPGTVEDSQNLSHSHGVADPGHVHSLNNRVTGQQGVNGSNGQSFVLPETVNTTSSFTGITIQANGGNESRPRNIGVEYYMRIL